MPRPSPLPGQFYHSVLINPARGTGETMVTAGTGTARSVFKRELDREGEKVKTETFGHREGDD